MPAHCSRWQTISGRGAKEGPDGFSRSQWWAACLMAEGKTTLRGVPRLSDIDSMSKLLGDLGCHVYRHEARESVAEDGPPLNGPLDITVTEEKKFQADYEIVRTMRASICTMG